MFAVKKSLARTLTVIVGVVTVSVVSIAATSAWAQSDTPVGLWKTIDDETKQARSLVRITESGGQLSGKIEKILSDKPDAVCDACSGELKDKPVLGMMILRGLKKGSDWWEGGTILDPNNGKTYRSQARTVDGGAKLEVRGYIGTPLLGRSQTWIREQ